MGYTFGRRFEPQDVDAITIIKREGKIKVRIVEKFEPLVKRTDDGLVTLGLFDTYGEAYDEVIRVGSSELPDNELVKAFQINKIFVNTAVYPLEDVEKGG